MQSHAAYLLFHWPTYVEHAYGLGRVLNCDCLPNRHAALCASPDPSDCLLRARLWLKVNRHHYSGRTYARQTMSFLWIGRILSGWKSSYVLLKGLPAEYDSSNPNGRIIKGSGCTGKWMTGWTHACWFVHKSHYKNPWNVMRAVAWSKNKWNVRGCVTFWENTVETRVIGIKRTVIASSERMRRFLLQPPSLPLTRGRTVVRNANIMLEP